MFLHFESIADILKTLYPDTTTARWVQNRANLRARAIPEEESLKTLVWRAVVFDAVRDGKLPTLITEALRDHPNATVLRQSRQTLLLRQRLLHGALIGASCLFIGWLL
ncbi:MAG: hypothetical protein HUU55_19880 [Myxococcales bacterium]|nr:hypothetical protein [Myxococcales bacterium]